jgi:hypothetical protein
MRAFSSKKYKEPIVSGNSLILSSIDGRMEVRVFEPIKFITPDNKSKVFKPMMVSAAPATKGN